MPADPLLLKKNNYSHAFFKIYCAFAEQELQQGYIIWLLIDISLVSGIYILKEVCYLRHQAQLSSFPIIVPLFHGST